MGEWTTRAEQVNEEAATYGEQAAQLCGRCQATGLDPDAYRGLSGAAVTLGAQPLRRGQTALADDHDFAQELDAVETDLVDFRAEVEHWRRATRDAMQRAQAGLGSDDEERQRRARAVVADCEEALAVLDGLDTRVRHALNRLVAVPDELGGTYLAAYRLVKSGRRMPHEGRWLEASR